MVTVLAAGNVHEDFQGPGEKLPLPTGVTVFKPTEETEVPTQVTETETVPETVETTAAPVEPVVEEPPAPWYASPFLWGGLALVFALAAAALAAGLLRSRKREKQLRARQRRARKEHRELQAEPARMENHSVPQTAPAAKSQTPEDRPYPVTGRPQDLQQTGPRILSAAVHEQGAREDQQDAWGLSPCDAYALQGVEAIVADGMGGLANGRAVSSALVRTFLEEFRRIGARMEASQQLLQTASVANTEVERLLEGAERSGSTLVSAIIRQGRLHFLTVGDSHIYLYRAGGLIQLNREHVYRERLALDYVNGSADLDQIDTDPQTGSLVSYYGTGRLEAVDRSQNGIRLVSGDRILLCSDGIFGTLTEAQMESAMALPLEQAAQAMGQAVKAANLSYQDNYTGLILEYQA